MIPASTFLRVLSLSTILWLMLLLASILFPPERDYSMRFLEKALVFIAALLFVVWTVLMLTFHFHAPAA